MPQIQRRTLPETGSLIERLYQAREQCWEGEQQFSLKNLLPPTLKGLEAACELLYEVWEKQETLLIVGDFDVDGATSTALCMSFFQSLGMAVDYMVPNRFEFGYGLTPALVDAIVSKAKPSLIITVDNGIASFEGVEAAQANGIKVLITDHHLPADGLPNADAIVNPNQPECPFPSKAAAGCTVAFYLCLAFSRYLQQKQPQLQCPSLVNELDLVALATVADVVPLDSNNRILVEQGLRRIRAGKARPGIYALIQVSGKDYRRLTSQDFGFALGPRLNAAGRMDDMSVGISCLGASNIEDALQAAHLLDDFNKQRRIVEQDMKQEAERILEKVQLSQSKLPKTLSLYNPSWHQGVVGIVASRMKEIYHRPVIAFAPSNQTGEIKGSARSIKGIHMRDMLDLVAKRNPNILQKFGGHAMAAGLSIRESDLAAFTVAFEKTVAEQVDDETYNQTILTDGSLAADEMSIGNAWSMKLASPWGQGFPEPMFDDEFEVVEHRPLKQQHLKMTVTKSGKAFEALFFNAPANTASLLTNGRIRMVYQLDVNTYQNREKVQLLIRHVLPA